MVFSTMADFLKKVFQDTFLRVIVIIIIIIKSRKELRCGTVAQE